MVENNKCVHGEYVHDHICYVCFLDFMCVCASTVSECVCLFVYLWAQEITEKAGTERASRSLAHRGKNSFLESYTSTGICLMSTRVERCIEHVRRPLAMRCG